MHPKVSHKAGREGETTWDAHFRFAVNIPASLHVEMSFSDWRKWQLGLWALIQILHAEFCQEVDVEL